MGSSQFLSGGGDIGGMFHDNVLKWDQFNASENPSIVSDDDRAFWFIPITFLMWGNVRTICIVPLPTDEAERYAAAH